MNEVNFDKRIKKLEESVSDLHGFSNILIFKNEDIFYLSGFLGKNSNSALLLADSRKYLFVNFIYLEEARKTAAENGFEIIKYSGDKNNIILEIINSDNIKNILLQSDFISHVDYLKLEAKLNETGIKSISIENPLENFRLIKDKDEQNLIKKACGFADEAFQYICGLGYNDFVGKRESIMAIEIEKFLINCGGSRKSFDYVIANNQSSSKPHYDSEFNIISDGILLMDYGIIFKNYCTDLTRTIFIGQQINKELKKIYEIVREAQMLAVDFCREGVTAKELDNIARKYISEKGYGKNFGHSIGHGVGLEIHEPPWINLKNDQILKEGMIITIEPGIYIENLGGVRIEDMVIVKKDGCENLYKSSKEAIQIY